MTGDGDPEAIRQAIADARKAGYSLEAITRIGQRTFDVYLFIRLPEADQQAIMRQANKEEFERHIGHAHMKLRGPMRQERAGKPAEAPTPAPAPAPAPRSIPAPRTAPRPPAPQPSAQPLRPAAPPQQPRRRSTADDLLQTSPLR